jgi:hypothetical protein
MTPWYDYHAEELTVANKSKANPKKLKSRNWLAVRAFQRTGSGTHGDKKKAVAKKACRGRVSRPN